MAATNLQVQKWSDQRTRVRAEQVRAVRVALVDDNASIAEVYANLTGSPDWADGRDDGPPSLLTPSDLLAFNTLSDNLAKILDGFAFADDAAKAAAVTAIQGQLAIGAKCCVKPLSNA
jgi:hypothetical protein